MNSTLFWNMIPCSLAEVYTRFRGMCRFEEEVNLLLKPEIRGSTFILNLCKLVQGHTE
jgi:hypothetical protein